MFIIRQFVYPYKIIVITSILYNQLLYLIELINYYLNKYFNTKTMNNPCSIFFDMERNSFYRIDKDTGIQAKSYLNGQNIPSFKLNVTGF